MTDRPTLMIVVSSTRPSRVGRAVADWAVEQAEAHAGFDVDLVDLAEVDLPLMNEPNHPRLSTYTMQHTLDWSARVDAADAFVRRGNDLRIAHGTTRLKPVCIAVRMFPVVEAVPIPWIGQQLDANGAFTTTDPLEAGAKAMLDELAKMTEVLSAVRRPAPTP